MRIKNLAPPAQTGELGIFSGYPFKHRPASGYFSQLIDDGCKWDLIRNQQMMQNPEHQDAKKIEVAEVIRERFDNRLFRFGAR